MDRLKKRGRGSMRLWEGPLIKKQTSQTAKGEEGGLPTDDPVWAKRRFAQVLSEAKAHHFLKIRRWADLSASLDKRGRSPIQNKRRWGLPSRRLESEHRRSLRLRGDGQRNAQASLRAVFCFAKVGAGGGAHRRWGACPTRGLGRLAPAGCRGRAPALRRTLSGVRTYVLLS